MSELLEKIENLKNQNCALLKKQLSNNFKFESCSMEQYIEWLSEQEKIV